MATKFYVSDSILDEKTYARKTKIRVGTSGDISFEAPFKMGIGNNSDSPIYEAHKIVEPKTIIKCLKSEKEDRAHGRVLKSRCRGKFNILTLEYGSKDIIPTNRMVEGLSDMQYNNTDAITTPSWFGLITKKDSTDVDLFLKLSEVYLSAASSRNHKPIIGAIPQSIPPEKLQEVIDFFINRDVTSFVVDSNSRTLISGSWLRLFQRSIHEYDLEKECVLYSMNAFQGTIRKTESSVEAKDFLGFAAGFDFIGGKYTNKYFGPRPQKDDITIGRMFDPSTYNYTKIECSQNEKTMIKDKSISFQIEEMKNVRDNITSGSTEKLLRSKKLLPETLDTIFSLKKNTRNRRLDEFI